MPRYFKIPEPQTLGAEAVLVEEKNGERVEHRLTLSFHLLHDLGIWESQKWLASSDAAVAQLVCRERIDAATAGEWVELPDDYFAVYQRIALDTQPNLKGTQLAPLAHRVGAARIQLLAPVISPPTKPPDPETKDDSTADFSASKDE